MTTVTAEWQRWVEAAKILARDPSVQVTCPRKKDAYLKVEDVSVPGRPGMVERDLTCSVCGATNIMRLPRPPAENGEFAIGDDAEPMPHEERHDPATALAGCKA